MSRHLRKARIQARYLIVGLVLGVALFFSLLPSDIGNSENGDLRIVCTFLPTYVFTRNVVGDTPGVDVELLVDRNVGCPHSYSVSGQDLKKISRADIIVANGLGIEPFLDELLRGQERAKLLTLSDDCEVIRTDDASAEDESGEPVHTAACEHGPETEHAHSPACEHVEEHVHTAECDHGQQAEHVHTAECDHGLATTRGDEHVHTQACEHGQEAEHVHGPECRHGHDHAGHDHAGHEHHFDVNPHTWVSPRQAAIQVRTLGRKLAQRDPENGGRYRANAEAYAAKLEALADRMVAASKSFTNRNIVTGHSAFDYLARDLGLNVVATMHVVPGQTPSAGEMARVIDTIRQTKAAAVFWEPPFADKTAQTIARDARVPVYPLNPFNTADGLPESETAEDVLGMYELVMERNLATLTKALTAPAPAPAPATANSFDE